MLKKGEEEAKKRRLKEIQNKFKILQKTEEELNKSIAVLRTLTPVNSPKKRGKTGEDFRANQGKVTKKTSKGMGKGTQRRRTTSGMFKQRMDKTVRSPHQQQNQGECAQLLSSLMDLKQGKTEKFTELVNLAMQATDNLTQLGNMTTSSLGVHNRIPPNSNLAEVATSVKTVDSKVGQEQLIDLLNELKQVKDSNQNRIDGNNARQINNESAVKYGQSESIEKLSEKMEEDKTKKNRKLISGKCTKPDESDIKQVVKYPHEKLDTKHVLDKVFDKLPFHLLVAGELEIALIQKDPERSKCIQVAKTICYHKQYLKDDDLRNGYNSIMKKVEQGNLNWTDDLAEELHKHYDYRANIILRERLNDSNYIAKKTDKTDRGGETKTGELIFEDLKRSKPVFCMEFNHNSYNNPESHEGNFGGKKCIKWHICHRCRQFGELRNHPELDPECPRK